MNRNNKKQILVNWHRVSMPSGYHRVGSLPSAFLLPRTSNHHASTDVPMDICFCDLLFSANLVSNKPTFCFQTLHLKVFCQINWIESMQKEQMVFLDFR